MDSRTSLAFVLIFGLMGAILLIPRSLLEGFIVGLLPEGHQIRTPWGIFERNQWVGATYKTNSIDYVSQYPESNSEVARADQLRDFGDVESLRLAYNHYERAFRIDPANWVACHRMGMIRLIQGRYDEASHIARIVLSRFNDIDLAYVKATLILTSIIDRRSRGKDLDTRQESCSEVLALLYPALDRCPTHTSTMVSVCKTLLTAVGLELKSINEFITFFRNCLSFSDFRKSFLGSLQNDPDSPHLLKVLATNAPEIYSLLGLNEDHSASPVGDLQINFDADNVIISVETPTLDRSKIPSASTKPKQDSSRKPHDPDDSSVEELSESQSS
jgi:hypothetical protein